MLEAPTSALCTLSTLHNSSWPGRDYEVTQPDTRQPVLISDRQTDREKDIPNLLSQSVRYTVLYDGYSKNSFSNLLQTPCE